MPSTATSHRSEERSNQQRVDSPSPLDAVIMFLISTLGGYLQLQYQSKNISPFDQHGNILKAIFLTLSMYAMGLMTKFKLRTHNLTWLSRFNPLIGILVVILLMKILFPLLGLVAFILWVLLIVEAIIKSFKEVYQWFSHENSSIGSEGNDSNAREENELPV